jgi:hypothetical protein
MNPIFNISELDSQAVKLVNYKLNVSGSHCFKTFMYKKYFFSFYELEGLAVDCNNRVLKSQSIEGKRGKGTHFDEYFNSSLNQWYKVENKSLIHK